MTGLLPVRALTVWLVVLGLVAGAGAAMALGSLVRGGPGAVASLRLVPAPGNAYAQRSLNPLTDLATDAQSVLSDVVLQDVSRDVGIDPERLREDVSVGIVPNAEVVEISYRPAAGGSPNQVVTALAERYLALRAERADLLLEARRAALVPRVQAAQIELADAVSADAEAAEARILSRRLAVLRSQLRGIVGPPSADGSTTGSLIRITQEVEGTAGLARVALVLGGALLGGLVAFGLDIRRRRRRSRSRTTEPADAPVVERAR